MRKEKVTPGYQLIPFWAYVLPRQNTLRGSGHLHATKLLHPRLIPQFHLKCKVSESYNHSPSLSLPSFSRLRLFSASWSAFLWYSVNRCCSMILSFSSRDTPASALFLRFACGKEQEQQWCGRNKPLCILTPCFNSTHQTLSNQSMQKTSWNYISLWGRKKC